MESYFDGGISVKARQKTVDNIHITYMSLISRLFKPLTEPIKSTVRMTLQEFLNSDSYQGQNGSFFSNFGLYSGNNLGARQLTSDIKVTPSLITEASRDTVLYGVIESLLELTVKKGWYFKGGKNTVNRYNDLLEEADYMDWVKQRFYALYAAGGGNAITYINEQGKLKLFPFIAEGYQRVAVDSDEEMRYINGYAIIKKGTMTDGVFNNAKQNNVLMYLEKDECLHSRVGNTDGDYRFGTGPIVAASRYYALKKKAMAATQTIYDNGGQAKNQYSPDAQFMSKLNPQEQEIYKDAIMHEINRFRNTYGLHNRNSDFFFRIPVQTVSSQMSNVDMQMLDQIIHLNREMVAAYRANLSIVGFPEGVNRATAEQERDNVSELFVEGVKKQIIKETVNFILPALSVGAYNKNLTPFYFGKEPTEEEIEVKQNKVKEYTKYFELAIKAHQAGMKIKWKQDHLENLPFDVVDILDQPETTQAKTQSVDVDEITAEIRAKKNILKLEKKGVTDFPTKGGNKKISLRNSQYPLFDRKYAKRIKEKYPEIWDKGGNIKGDDQYEILTRIMNENNGVPITSDQEEAIKLREAWAARHIDNKNIEGVIAQVKWLVIGSRGISHMKKVIKEEIDKIEKNKTRSVVTFEQQPIIQDAKKRLEEAFKKQLINARDKMITD